jgi:hypothetical protein
MTQASTHLLHTFEKGASDQIRKLNLFLTHIMENRQTWQLSESSTPAALYQ